MDLGVEVATHRSREERSLGEAQHDSHSPELASVLDECGARADRAPNGRHDADVYIDVQPSSLTYSDSPSPSPLT
jgi:hypothetical protein